MSENEGQARAEGAGEKPAVEESPSEKLEEKKVTDSLIPGAQNPDSEEIKQEVNPNTE
ncbi:MAG: hypothetical protein WCB68_21250 [Pyrinomonadaceae bacterium]